MKDILTAPFIVDICKLTSNLYRLGWDERNGGNVSYLVPQQEVAEYLDLTKVTRNIPMKFNGSFLAGKLFVVTGSGKYFKNVEDA
ncbi:MAG: class II aldolase/adducin family protein, partial [Oscillospiraceae bacterium]